MARARILEDLSVSGIRTRHTSVLGEWDAGTEVDGIASGIDRIEFGAVHLNDGPVFSVILAANADADGEREVQPSELIQCARASP